MTVVKVNRAPVLTLWAGIVAQRLGYDEAAALTLGRALAGLNAQSKGKRLGIYQPAEKEEGEVSKGPAREKPLSVDLMGRSVPAVQTASGIRATSGGRPIDPESVRRYVASKFGARLAEVRRAMEDLASAFSPEELAGEAYRLYESFRPQVPRGTKGWGAAGEMDLDQIRRLARGGTRAGRP